jgi:hypothetical protein
MAFTHEERPLSELFGDLMQEVKLFFRQEMQLLKIEMSQKGSQAGKDVVFLAIGGALAYAGLLVLLAAAILALASVMPGWASALIVGLVVVGVGYALLQKGLSDLKRLNPAPEHTISSLKETKQWTTHAIK